MDAATRRLLTLGREYFEARDYNNAESCLRKVVEQYPTFADVQNLLGQVYHALGRFREAENAFEAALTQNARYTEAALNLAVTYNDVGKYDKAREIYNRALATTRDAPGQLDPFVRGKIANLHGELGDAYAGAGLGDLAMDEYRRALSLAPSFVDIRTKLARVAREASHFEDALREVEHVLREKPDYLPARIQLGITLHALGRREEACREWEAVLSAEPGNKAAQAYLRILKGQ